ncbi:MAG: carbohydrate-binding protein [Candidatus Limnocylindrales bacterium]
MELRKMLAAQAPYLGAPFVVGTTPVTIQAEDYDVGGEGVAYRDTTATNSGGAYRTGADAGVDVKLIANTTSQFRIGDAYPGEWVEYSLDIKQSGTYALELRLSQSDGGGRVHVAVDGVDASPSLAVPDTNSFSTFQTVSTKVALSAGHRVLRFAFDAAAPNGTSAGVDWLRFSPLAALPRTFYLSVNGSDGNAGTSTTSAWRTIGKLNTMDFQPGDTILLQGGQSFGGTLSFNAADSGTDSAGNLIAPITVGSYGTGRATINAGTDTGIIVYRAGETSFGTSTSKPRPATTTTALRSTMTSAAT